MAIRKAPDRAPTASLGMIDYTTTARLGEKGIDLVTEAVQNKQNRDRLEYETAKSERKQAEVNLASFDAMAESNPDVLNFIKTDDGVLGDAYKNLQSGKASYQDSLILTGGATQAIKSVSNKQAIRASEAQAELAEFQLKESKQDILNKQAVGTAFTKAMVKGKGPDGKETISFDPSIARNFVLKNNPQAINMLEEKIQTYQKDTLDRTIKLGTMNAQLLEAEANVLEQEIANAKYEGEKKHNRGMYSSQLFAEGELRLGRKMSAREYMSQLRVSGVDFADSESLNKHIELMAKSGVIKPPDSNAIIKIKAQEELSMKNYENDLGSTWESQSILNKNTQELQKLIKGPSALQQFGEFFADIVGMGTLPSDAGSTRFGPTSEIMGVRSEYSASIKGLFDVLTSANVIDRMIELKEASPTGSTGFGQISAPELDLLKATKLALSEAQASGKMVAGNIVQDYLYITNRVLYKQFKNYATNNDLTNKETAKRLGISIDNFEFANNVISDFEKTDRFRDLYESMGTADSSLQTFETMEELKAKGGDKFDRETMRQNIQSRANNPFSLSPNPSDPYGGSVDANSLSGYYSGSGYKLKSVKAK